MRPPDSSEQTHRHERRTRKNKLRRRWTRVSLCLCQVSRRWSTAAAQSPSSAVWDAAPSAVSMETGRNSVWIHRLWCRWQFSRCSAGSVRGQHRTAPYKEEGSAIERCPGKRLWTCTASQCVDCTANATLTPYIWADGRNEKKEARKGRRQGNKNRKEETIKRS